MSFISIPPLWITVAAGILTAVLGAAYLVRSGAIAKDLKLVITDHRRVVTMALVTQGLALCFIGIVVVVSALTAQRGSSATIVSFLCAGMLLVLGFVTAATGGRGEYVLFRVGQIATVVAAMMILVGNLPR
jgi:hypothetical protein